MRMTRIMGNNQNREGWRVGSRSKSVLGSAIDFARECGRTRRRKKWGYFERVPVCGWIDRWGFSVCVCVCESESERV